MWIVPLSVIYVTVSLFLFFNYPATTEIYTDLHTLSLHDALPIYRSQSCGQTSTAAGFIFSSRIGHSNGRAKAAARRPFIASSSESVEMDRAQSDRSEEHTSELQSLMRISYAVFRLTKKNT